MKMYIENGVPFELAYDWVSNGKYPVVTFDNYLFTEDFSVTTLDETPLVEGTDFLRILRSKDVSMKFGLDIFGGIVLLTTDTISLKLIGVASTPFVINYPDSVIDPYSVDPYAIGTPMTGGFNDLISMIDEITVSIPNIKGNTLPLYINANLNNPSKQLTVVSIRMNINFPTMVSTPPYVPIEEQYDPRLGFTSIDAMPLDSIQLRKLNSNPTILEVH